MTSTRSPNVSVILPIHNAADYLAACLKQLQEMSNSDLRLEFVVVNDHSVDGSMDMLERWCHERDDVVLVHATGTGVAAARNQAIQFARGEFVWFTDADDSWDRTIIDTMYAGAMEENADLVVCNARKTLPDGTTAGDILDAPMRTTVSGAEGLVRLLEGSLQGHLWNKLLRRDLLTQPIFPQTRAHSDLGGLIEIMPRATRVLLLPHTLYEYRLHPGSILNSRAYRWDDLPDCLAIAKRAVAGLQGYPAAGSALTEFTYRNVVLPIANETARRSEWESESDLAAVTRRNRSRTTWPGISRLLLKRRFTLAMRAALYKLSTSLYSRVYRWRRKPTWSSLDAL